ncbi:MAG: ribosomal RNA small subunit methyltransferase A [Spirochaetales bacterium]|nr:ribosomal RNA small subunit methyltransferase A [Spirochaetales bacterium]
MAINYESASAVAEVLKIHGLHLSKKFGQNFLLHPYYQHAIIGFLDAKEGETVWEIGPGIGALTHKLVTLPVKLKVFEIDRGFIPLLYDEFGHNPHFSLQEGDFLKTWKDAWAESPPDRIIGNLPYSVGSVIIADLVKSDIDCKRMVFTLQKEVVERITAKPATKEYSGFSLICQYKWNCRKGGSVPRHVFFPVPDVTSAYVGMDHDDGGGIVPRALYDDFVNDLFRSRRKTIRNNLKQGMLQTRVNTDLLFEACQKAGIALDSRGEQLSVSEVISVCTYIMETGTWPKGL